MKGLLAILTVGGVLIALVLAASAGWIHLPGKASRSVPDAGVAVRAPVEVRPVILAAAREASSETSAPSPRGNEERLAAIELRIEALERTLAARREPTTLDAGAVDEERLRERVLDWIAQDHAQRARDEAREAEDAQRREIEFDARYRARTMTHEHDLTTAQEESLVELFVEVEERRRAVEANIDIATDDPDEVEARWLVFDEWADRREREVTAQVSAALYEALYGEE